jgi:hypothetical protein
LATSNRSSATPWRDPISRKRNPPLLLDVARHAPDAIGIREKVLHRGPKEKSSKSPSASPDSFALRNHGLKAIVPGVFPERAFSTEYALKDLSYALELARDAGLRIRGAELTGTILQEAIDAGSGREAIHLPQREWIASSLRSSQMTTERSLLNTPLWHQPLRWSESDRDSVRSCRA